MQRIHTLWLCGFALLATAAGGCTMDGPDDTAFSVSWSVRRADGVPIPCSDVLAETVRFEMRPLTGNTAANYNVDAACAQGGLTSPVLPTGQYMARVWLFGPGNADVLGGPLEFDQPVIISGTGITQLPNIVFTMPTGNGQPQLALQWRLAYVGAATNTPALDCAAAGATSIEVSVAAGNAAPMVVSFACAAGTGITPRVTPGIYTVNVTVKDAAGRIVSGIGPEVVPIYPIGRDYGGIEFPIQSFATSWSITKAGAASTCQAVGATTVQLDAQKAPEAGQPAPAPLVFQFPCADLEGVTQAVNVGTYAISLTLLDAAGKPLAPAQSMAAFVASADARAILPAVTFAVP